MVSTRDLSISVRCQLDLQRSESDVRDGDLVVVWGICWDNWHAPWIVLYVAGEQLGKGTQRMSMVKGKLKMGGPP